MEIKVNAVLIRSCDYGENDKILTLLSAEEGKISAGIKGVRKAGAKLKFAAQPFCFCEYVIARRSNRNTVISASENESFYDIRTDINKFYAAGAVCEAVDGLSMEGYDCHDLFYACVTALTEICNGNERLALIKFLLTALAGAGYAISMGSCPMCGSKLINSDRLRFNMVSGAFTCEECSEGALASPSTYNVLRHALGRECNGLCLTLDGERRALKLLREFIKSRAEAKCASLSELIKLL